MNRMEELLTGGGRGGGDGRVKGSSAIGGGGQATVSLTPDVDGMHIRTFESSQLEGSYVGDLLYGTCTKLHTSYREGWKGLELSCLPGKLYLL